MPSGPQQLYFYWRVAPAHTRAALHALQVWQEGLRAQQPDLQARCHLRRDAAAGYDTVMESYAFAAGRHAARIDAALRRRIEQEGGQLLRRWLIGPRHVEQFDEWPTPAGR